MPETTPRKPTIWILDDSWQSALAKISYFYSFTSANLPGAARPKSLEALDRTNFSPGFRLACPDPDSIWDEDLRDGILLIDVNWSLGGGSERVGGLTLAEREHFGITLANEVLARRKPLDNLEVIVFSHTRAAETNSFINDLHYRGIDRVQSAVILDENRDGKVIHTLGRRAYIRLVSNLSHGFPEGTAQLLASVRNDFEKNPSSIRPDLSPLKDSLSDRGIALGDLLVPEQDHWETLSAECESRDLARERILLSIDALLKLFGLEEIAFELPGETGPLGVEYIRALLRYGTIRPLDGLLHLAEVPNSRFADPAKQLSASLENAARDPSEIALRATAGRIPSVLLGAKLAQIRKGKDAEKTSLKTLPRILLNEGSLEVLRSKDPRRGKLTIVPESADECHLEVDPNCIVSNSLLEARTLLEKSRQTTGKARGEYLFRAFEADPGNLELITEIAREAESMAEDQAYEDPAWEPILRAAKEAFSRLEYARDSLESYEEQVRRTAEEKGDKWTTPLLRDLSDASRARRDWEEACEDLDSLIDLLSQHRTSETDLRSRLRLLISSDHPSERVALCESTLGHLYPRMRGYARSILNEKVKATELLARPFATLFPASDPETTSRNWLKLVFSVIEDTATLSAPSEGALETKLVQRVGGEMVRRILEGLPPDALFESEEEDVEIETISGPADASSGTVSFEVLTDRLAATLSPVLPKLPESDLAEILGAFEAETGIPLPHIVSLDAERGKPALTERNARLLQGHLHDHGINVAWNRLSSIWHIETQPIH